MQLDHTNHAKPVLPCSGNPYRYLGAGMTAETLTNYGFRVVANLRIEDRRFIIEPVDFEAMAFRESIYAFLIGDTIARFGSSKGVLASRFRSWERDVTGRLANRVTSTPETEGDDWLALLPPGVTGTVWARLGTMVTTPAGTFSAYMSEESYLIGKHLPKMNRSKHR